MGATQIPDALPGEDLLGIEPELLQQVSAGWLQRLSLFTGRTLSDTALTNEQNYRSGRLTMLGQAVTAGTVSGLDLSVHLSAADPALSVAPGYGISATGQDVTLLRPMRTLLSGLAVIDGISGAYLADFKNFTPPTTAWTGVLLIQSIVAQVPGSAVDNGTGNIIVSGNLAASCDQDTAESAFGDSQVVDGARLVLATWPSPNTALVLPPALPAATWRNRLVYTVFNAEIALLPDDYLPWQFLGVPVALAAFDSSSKLLFADRSSVVRAGGLPRRRYIIPTQNGQLLTVQPALANARVSQFAEQLGQDLSPASPPGLIASEFAFLPPTGVLPPYTMDFVNQVALWCPSNWIVTATPVYLEELEGILQAGITAAPLDTSQNETIEILVPLPDEVYDPNVLLTEQVDPVFAHEVQAATLARNIVLQHRKIIEQEANALAAVLKESAIDLDDGLTSDEISGRDGASVFTPLPAEAFGTDNTSGAYVSSDLQTLRKIAGQAPYTITYVDSLTQAPVQLPLFNDGDWKDLNDNGLEHFIDGINAKLDKANDLLDLAFLTTQTDIYRYRQNILGTSDATRLAVSPILANIASGDTAAATAQNIHDYLATIAANKTTTNTLQVVLPAAPAPAGATTPAAASTSKAAIQSLATTFSSPVLLTQTKSSALSAKQLSTFSTSQSISAGQRSSLSILTSSASPSVSQFNPATFVPISVGTVDQPASPVDITQQSPIAGAQLNLRTLTIADRLTQPRSQEALVYSIGNRSSILQLLAELEISIADIPVILDTLPPNAVNARFLMADLLPSTDPKRISNTQAVLQAVNKPILDTYTDESGVFSAGIFVLEQHSQLLRAVEGRIQLYRDFLTLWATTTLASVTRNLSAAQTLLAQLENDLTQSRQNLAFVGALLADEKARVNAVNATRTGVLANFVQFIAYTRPRILLNRSFVFSRQLQPSNVASPVPACLNQSVAIPPELREIVALLREAPVSWFPPISSRIPDLERPNLLMNLAVSTQARASMQLQLPLPTSSALSSPGVYAPAIANLYSTQQLSLRTLQTQRAAFQPSVLLNQSWTTQVGILQNVVAVADLQSSASVHAEVAAAASRTMQQISSVATCLYTRVSQALPANRLAWAEFLRGPGASVSLRSLAVLPGWSSQTYVDRQQMQLLVDWLYQQIDATDPNAAALTNDLVAVAILLASHAPVDNIISGAVALRTKPAVGGPIRLTLPTQGVAHGMYVDLYSAGKLSAKAVVSDLDSTGVTATITDIYQPGVTFDTTDVAHYTTLAPNAVVFKAFSS